jgi:hypothetical protein
MTFKKQLLLCAIITVLLSCSSPMNKKFSKETMGADMKDIRTQLDSTELALLVGAIIHMKLNYTLLETMTYAEILAKGEKWKEEKVKIEAEQKNKKH